MTSVRGIKRDGKKKSAPKKKKVRAKAEVERSVDWADEQLGRCKKGIDKALGALERILDSAIAEGDSAAVIRIAKYLQEQETTITKQKVEAERRELEAGRGAQGHTSARASRILAGFGGHARSAEGS